MAVCWCSQSEVASPGTKGSNESLSTEWNQSRNSRQRLGRKIIKINFVFREIVINSVSLKCGLDLKCENIQH